MLYQQSDRPTLSALEVSDGVIYHQRGEYHLTENDGSQLVPVNRSYFPVYAYQGLTTDPEAQYQYARLIHDTIPDGTKLIGRERILQIMGKNLLFLEITDPNYIAQIYSSKAKENLRLSAESRRAIDILANGLTRRMVDVVLGVHGSHAVRLNGVDSDLDLITWSPREQRADTISAISDVLLKHGYVDANTTHKFSEYATRIASLTSLPKEVGAFLAAQRLRWISPNGVPTSLQSLHSDYNHSAAAEAVNGLVNGECETVGEVTDFQVEVTASSDPFNFPRVWTVDSGSQEYRVISFNWLHQGMGHDGLNPGKSNVCLVSATHLRNNDGGNVLFMKSDSHYLLPADVIASV